MPMSPCRPRAVPAATCTWLKPPACSLNSASTRDAAVLARREDSPSAAENVEQLPGRLRQPVVDLPRSAIVLALGERRTALLQARHQGRRPRRRHGLRGVVAASGRGCMRHRASDPQVTHVKSLKSLRVSQSRPQSPSRLLNGPSTPVLPSLLFFDSRVARPRRRGGQGVWA